MDLEKEGFGKPSLPSRGMEQPGRSQGSYPHDLILEAKKRRR